MYFPLYIPKSVILGFLIVVGCTLGWMLHVSANEVARAELRAPVMLQSSPTVAGPLPSTRALNSSAAAIKTTRPVDRPTIATSGSPVERLAGDASTVRSTAHIESAPDRSGTVLVGTAGPAVRSGDLPVGDEPTGAPSSAAPLDQAEPTPPLTRTPPAHLAAAPEPMLSVAPQEPTQPSPVTSRSGPQTAAAQPLVLSALPSYIEPIFKPIPSAATRGASFAEWETSRVDVLGRNIMVTFDDSNVFSNRDGKLNTNTGDTDASGLNITDATDSVILGTESADEAPYQTVAAALVDLASDAPGGGLNSDPDDDADDDGDANDPDPGADGLAPAPVTTVTPVPKSTPIATRGHPRSDKRHPGGNAGDRPFATPATGASAAVVASNDDDSQSEEFDFPYVEWTRQISGNAASAVHTDEGTTLASGADDARRRSGRLRR